MRWLGDVDARAAARRFDRSTRGGERLDDALAQRGEIDLPRRRGDDHAHAPRDAPAAQDRGSLAQIIKPPVGARADERDVDALTRDLGDGNNIVDAMSARDLRRERGRVDADAFGVHSVRVRAHGPRLSRAPCARSHANVFSSASSSAALAPNSAAWFASVMRSSMSIAATASPQYSSAL